MKKLSVMALAILILLPLAANAQIVTKEGDPAFFYGFPASTTMLKGETRCYELGPANFGFVSGTCTATDTFCVEVWDELGWPMTNGFTEPFILDSGYLTGHDVCITVPCEVTVGTINNAYAIVAFTDVAGVCQPDSGDCEDPNIYSGGFYYQIDSLAIEIVESPPALYILQDTLYYVEQGQTAAYVPFSICNGDPCAPPTDYGYTITSLGTVGGALDIADTALGVVGGECAAVYGIVDAGAAAVCTFDELTIIVWDLATGTVYDTCVQEIHVVEPIPVPLFTAPVVTILVLAMILAAAVIMKRHAVSKA
jgi:hypothetical protein